MSVDMFATIEVGSYSVSLQIFELSKKNGIQTIDTVTHRLELGKTTYATGKVTAGLIDALCIVIKDFVRIMEEYQVREYRAYATSAVR